MDLKVFETPGKEWDEFASRYTDLIFYQSIWSEVLRKGLGGQPLYFYLKEGDGIVAGLPGLLLNFKILKITYSSIPYGNLLGEKAYFPLLLELLEKEFKKRGIDQVRITDSPFSEPYRPSSYQTISTKVSLLDMRGVDKERIWKEYKKYIRRDVRKAQRSGVTIRQGGSIKDVKLFYDLYLASMKRNRAAAKYPFQWFKALCEEGPGKSLGTIRFAVLNQSAIAGVVLVPSSSTTHYFHSGSQEEFLRYCPNELLIHHSIEDAIERGSSFFDFMGSDRKDLNLIHFKEKWGSQSFDIHTYVKDYRPLRCFLWETGKRWMTSRLGMRLLKMLQRETGV
ncbi:MAG: hypothetical protein A2156_04625 [Deltaproteobacteria bacterium RBG_16_48_10]|nr:MAG: hypothetical protein A2156_04625 [Deltaproteobacteria bacterium RBG_16_48_10]